MIDEAWRSLLYYPLGLLPLPFFFLRMLFQWLQSEKEKTSIVTPLFWKLSLLGNCLLLSHYYIQLQYPFGLLQVGNGLIAWRNLHLIKRETPITTHRTLLRFSLFLLLFTLAFFIESFFFSAHHEWMRIPLQSHKTPLEVAPIISLLGTLGSVLFASRFWIQWWQAERSKKSQLTSLFWWMSLLGSCLSLFYFYAIFDVVSLLHYSFTLIPCTRNLLLLRVKAQELT